ncbi:MAG: 1-acyl-sn-glycerol-3-phosphate acyltransferase [Balneolaceae bacterium]|nr:1-acyl-sn-glycerol-3-phosphate acyltransferase [Balneolaceae bacterium]MBO6546168.1 1-acyl-sn-glycerol-3-phosphate acyltransferase [Balneolaceae bacterium]MBO6648526.1 1-acyl-sn-glycerol-3-phosphate acyltransferase [Balneolaceae bacterium]
MRKVIAVLKISLFLLTTLFYYSLIVSGKLLVFFGIDKLGWSAKFRKKWGVATLKILGIKTKVVGEPPKPPFFLVSNHLSYVDVWVLFSQLNCTFIAKSEVREWPVIGFVLATSGMLFVDRERRRDVTRVNDEISNHLTDSQGVVLFPEGTTSMGAEVLAFKSSLFQYPAVEELPVHCVSISYSAPQDAPSAHKTVCWWDDTPFFKHIFYLFVMKECSATVTFSEETIVNSNRKILAQSAHKIIERSFDPVIDSETYAKTTLGS